MTFDPLVYRDAEINSIDGHLVSSVSVEEYVKAFEGFETFPVMYGGKQVGGAAMRSFRFHIAVLPEYRGLVGRQIVKAINWGLDISNPFIASVNTLNTAVLGLVRRMPNELIYEFGDTQVYLIRREI
jgi:hypothetical protein